MKGVRTIIGQIHVSPSLGIGRPVTLRAPLLRPALPGEILAVLRGGAIAAAAVLLGLAPAFAAPATTLAMGNTAIGISSNATPKVVTTLAVTCPAGGAVLVSGSGESTAISTNAGTAFIGLAYSIARDSSASDNANVIQSSALARYNGDSNSDILNIQRVDTCTPGRNYTYNLTVYGTTPDTSTASFVANGRLTASVPYSSPGAGLAPGSTLISSASNAAPTIISTLSVICPASGAVLVTGAGESAAVSTNPSTAFIGLAYSISRDSFATDNGNVVQSSALAVFNGDANRDFLNVQRVDSCTPGTTYKYRLTAYRTTPDTGSGSFVWNGGLAASDPISGPAAGYTPGTTNVASADGATPTIISTLTVTCPATGVVWIVGSGESASVSNAGTRDFIGLAYSIARDSTAADPNNAVRSSALSQFNGDANRDYLNVQRADTCTPGLTYAYRLTAYRTTAITGTNSFVWNGRLAALSTLPAVAGATATGAYRWAKQIGSPTGTVAGYATALDASGNVYVAGQFWGSLDFGGSTLTSAGSSDIYLAKFSASGAPIWAKRFGGAVDDAAYAVKVDNSGNVIIAGSYMASVDFGSGTAMTAVGAGTTSDVFVAKYSPNGDYIWAKSYGGAGAEVARGLAVDASDNIVVTGSFEGRALFGSLILTSSYSSTDMFLAKISSAGALAWAKSFGSSGIDSGFGVAFDSSGNILLVGSFMGQVTFGGVGGVTLSSLGVSDVVVAKVSSAAGAIVWARAFGGAGEDGGYAIAAAANGDPVVTGFVQGSVDFGAGATSAQGQVDTFVARYASVDGAHVWSRRMGSNMITQGYGIAADAGGNVLVVGGFEGTANFGTGALTSAGGAGGADLFCAKYSATGTPLWSKAFGAAGDEIGYAVAFDAGGDAIVTGTFQRTVDFGGGAISAAGQLDTFVLNLAP